MSTVTAEDSAAATSEEPKQGEEADKQTQELIDEMLAEEQQAELQDEYDD